MSFDITKLDSLNKKLEEIEETKIYLKELEKSLSDITKKFKDYSEEEIIEIANYLYWNVSQIKSKVIAEELLNMTIRGLLKIIKPFESNIKCKLCNTSLFCKSRNELTYNRNNKFFICKKCREQRNEERIKTRDIETSNRNKNINYLKNLQYSEYLQSKHWRHFRENVLKRSNYRCSICNTDNNIHVHHRTYENRGHENYEDVIVLCGNCHHLFHKTKHIEKEVKNG